MEESSLCQACAEVKILKNKKGSTFYLCLKHKEDLHFPKYPRQPVKVCNGFVPQDLIP